MLSDTEFIEVAERVVAELRPCFDANWADIIDNEIGGGEFFVAVDDALQAAALAQYPASSDLFADVAQIASQLAPESGDRERIIRWTEQIPHARAA